VAIGKRTALGDLQLDLVRHLSPRRLTPLCRDAEIVRDKRRCRDATCGYASVGEALVTREVNTMLRRAGDVYRH
jgi:hypothetical protein